MRTGSGACNSACKGNSNAAASAWLQWPATRLQRAAARRVLKTEPPSKTFCHAVTDGRSDQAGAVLYSAVCNPDFFLFRCCIGGAPEAGGQFSHSFVFVMPPVLAALFFGVAKRTGGISIFPE